MQVLSLVLEVVARSDPGAALPGHCRAIHAKVRGRSIPWLSSSTLILLPAAIRSGGFSLAFSSTTPLF